MWEDLGGGIGGECGVDSSGIFILQHSVKKNGKSAVSGLQACKFCSYGIYIDPKTLTQQSDETKKP